MSYQARAILLNDLGEIALLHKDKKNEYKLIGGGIEGQETLQQAKQEKDEGAELCWYKPEIALKKINDSYGKLLPSKYSDLYNSKIIIKRDYLILKFYIQNNVENLCTQQLTSNVYTIFE